MKKILGLILASFIGGAVAIIGSITLIDHSTVTNSNAEQIKAEPINNVFVGHTSNLDFVDAAGKTVHAVVHVKVRSHNNGYDNSFYNFLFK